MPKHRFVIDDRTKVYSALVTAADAARESPLDFDLGPWDDDELLDTGTIEVVGPDEAVDLVAQRLIQNDIGFEVEDDEVAGT